jgi:hypothetical protein
MFLKFEQKLLCSAIIFVFQKYIFLFINVFFLFRLLKLKKENENNKSHWSTK